MKIQYNKNHKIKVVVIVLLFVVAVLVAALGGYMYIHKDDIKRDANGTSTERTGQDIKLEEDLKSNPENKSNNTQTDTPTAPAVDTETKLQKVNVILTYTGQSGDMVSASGFVSNAIEEGGSCKYVFISDQKTVEKTSTTLANANSTTCKTVRFDKSELAAGLWKVQIEYTSSVSTGKSNILEMNVT